MNLHIARQCLQNKPPKRLIEMTLYEAVILSLIAMMLVYVLY